MFSGNLPSYGFANKVQGVFVKTKDEFKVIVDLPDPDSTVACEREARRLKCEEIAFSSHHYCADFMEEDVVEPYLQFNSKFQSRKQVTLNHEEQEKLLSFGNKEYLLNKEEKKIVLLSLVDILFAYSYNHRTTYGEDSSEDSSECAWTVNKLSATLCWFQYFKTINDVIKTCIRRSLCYPLYRNFKLSLKVLEDTTNILKGGRKQIIKCLLHIHKLFNESEPRYILNELYIKDYCIWVQNLSDSRIENLIESIQKVIINKCDLNLELEELETAAILVQKETDEERLLQQVMNLDIHSKNSSDEEEESSSNESDYETDSESSSETETESLDSDDESSVSDT
uniref:Protein SHQ1 homolog n=1 Tax=Clastoptera arizonana TaxID=38151 RepID=A0A1B6DBX3_9HEMI